MCLVLSCSTVEVLSTQAAYTFIAEVRWRVWAAGGWVMKYPQRSVGLFHYRVQRRGQMEETYVEYAVRVTPWTLLGGIVVAHFALSGLSYLLVGSRRNTAAVLGGSDSDNSQAKAAVKQGSPMAFLLAYNMIAVGYAVYCSFVGTMAWIDRSEMDKVSGTLESRLYGRSAPYESIAQLTIAYEIYNTAAVIFLHEYRNAPFIGHHTTCLLLGLMSMHPFCHYYATFFFGLTAISSVPLALVELAQAVDMPAAVELFRTLFAILFLTFRTVYWCARHQPSSPPARATTSALKTSYVCRAQADRVVRILGRRARGAQRRGAGAQLSRALSALGLKRRPHRPPVLLDLPDRPSHRGNGQGAQGQGRQGQGRLSQLIMQDDSLCQLIMQDDSLCRDGAVCIYIGARRPGADVRAMCGRRAQHESHRSARHDDRFRGLGQWFLKEGWRALQLHASFHRRGQMEGLGVAGG